MTDQKDSRIGYMCKVDFMWELGEAMGGNKIYASIEDLKEKYRHFLIKGTIYPLIC